MKRLFRLMTVASVLAALPYEARSGEAETPDITLDFLAQGFAAYQSSATFTVPVVDETVVGLDVTITATSGGAPADFGDVNGLGLRVKGGTEDVWWDTNGGSGAEQLVFSFVPRDVYGVAASATVHIQEIGYRHSAGDTTASVIFTGGSGTQQVFAETGVITSTELASPYMTGSTNALVLTRGGSNSIFQLRAMVLTLSDMLPGPNPEYGKAVVTSDPTIVTHTFQVGDMLLGMTTNGGGFINYVSLDGGATSLIESEARYGRGWQGSLRDSLHGGRYNPTQAGFRDFAGTPTQLIDDNGRLVIRRYNMPLYSDAVFDFTQFEELGEDYPGYNDGLNMNSSPIGDPYIGDRDAFEEPVGWTQDDEVRSEFDFEGFYEDAGDPAGNGCSVLRFFQRYSYVRDPKGIYQFGPGAVRLDGDAVYHPEQITIQGDLSDILPGEQLATEVDLARATFTAYGIRLSATSGFTNKMWYYDGHWITEPFDLGNGGERFKIPGSGITGNPSQTIDYGFLVVANGTNTATARAFAVYVPMVEANRKTVVGKHKSDESVAYREERFNDCFILFSSAHANQVSIRSRYILRGMLAPGHGKPDVYEALESDQYVLYGSPDQILATVQALETDLYYGSDTPHGTPRSWMEAYGITDENSDTDGDGLAAWQEYRAGTDPARLESVFAITESAPEAATDRFVIKWQAVDGKTYSVLSTTNLLSNAWNTNAVGIPGIEPESAYTSALDKAELFIKIGVE